MSNLAPSSSATNSQVATTSRKSPKPPLVFHIGVTGHRPDPAKRPAPNEPAIRETVRSVLEIILEAVNSVAQARDTLFQLAPPSSSQSRATGYLRLLTSLAEGPDQWLAEEADQQDFAIHAVLPFPRHEYRKDFIPAPAGSLPTPLDPARVQELQTALQCFDQFTDPASSSPRKCEVLFELDGTRNGKNSSKSYLAAGRQIIQQSDLLIAVWDGEDKKGVGGTEQIVKEALLNGVPVIWIPWTPATASGTWHVLSSPAWKLLECADDTKDDASRLRKLILDILLPPDVRATRRHLDPQSLRPVFLDEVEPGSNCLVGFWGFFTGLLAFKRNAKGRERRPPLKWRAHFRDFENVTREAWKREIDAEPGLKATPPLFNTGLYAAPYAWANLLSIYYAGLYRSSFVLNYLLGAAAVLIALIGVFHPRLNIELSAIIFELAIISWILVLTLFGKHCRWHERWLEYRTLAERLRLSQFMALLGGWRQQTAMPGHLATYGDPINSWVHWYYRAVERFGSFPDGAIDQARLDWIKLAFQKLLVREQINYHHGNSARLHTVDHRLHLLGTGLFFLTFLSCAIHLAVVIWLDEVPNWATALLITSNAFLPALGAAFAAIRSQGEFQRLVRRSEAMHETLTELQDQLSAITPMPNALKSQELRRAVERVAQVMLNETLDWRIVFQDRPLNLPS